MGEHWDKVFHELVPFIEEKYVVLFVVFKRKP